MPATLEGQRSPCGTGRDRQAAFCSDCLQPRASPGLAPRLLIEREATYRRLGQLRDLAAQNQRLCHVAAGECLHLIEDDSPP